MVASAPALAGKTVARAVDTKPFASAKGGVKASLSKLARASVKTDNAGHLNQAGTIGVVLIATVAVGGAIGAGVGGGTAPTTGSPR